MEKLFITIGLMTCLTAVTCPISFWIHNLEKYDTQSSLATVLGVLNAILLFCSAPVSLIVFAFCKLTEKKCSNEYSKKSFNSWLETQRTISDFEKKLEISQKEKLLAMQDEYRRGFDAGQKSSAKKYYDMGYESGEREGYREGLKMGREIKDFTEEELNRIYNDS